MTRRNRFDVVPQSIVFATGVVLAVIFVSVMIYEFDSSKELSNAVNRNLSELTVDVEESNVTMYDGITVNGADVINFVKRNYAQDCVFETDIVLQSGATAAVRDSQMLLSLRDENSVYYVRASARFSCDVSRNGNGVIDFVVFTQK